MRLESLWGCRVEGQSRSWVLRYAMDASTGAWGWGSYPAITLAMAGAAKGASRLGTIPSMNAAPSAAAPR